MGNCQAVDAAALAIQHPNGKLERLYWPTPASEVMKMNPGHYVALIIPLPITTPPPPPPPQDHHDIKKQLKRTTTATNTTGDYDEKKMIRFTRVKLLRPTDTLVLGRAYRLVTTQEVMEVLRAKKMAKMKKNEADSGANDPSEKNTYRRKSCSDRGGSRRSETTVKNNQEDNSGREVVGRSRSWRPSLQSISETAT